MDQIVSIIDVAKRAGVAKSTVSNVLSGKKYVSDELKQRVLRVCEELNYHPNFYASALSSKKTNIIALLLESSENIEQKMYQNLVTACIKEASVYNYALLVYYNSKKESIIETLRKGCAPIDGAIMMSPCIKDERILQFDSQNTSFVVIGRPENANHYNCVDIDNVALVKETTMELIKLSGETNIYLVNSDESMTISQDRQRGFEAGCIEVGVDALNRIIHKDDLSALESRVVNGSVFITCDDVVALRIYEISKGKGLVIGKDVSVFSLGRSIVSGTFDPPLSYAEQDYTMLGKKAVEMLVFVINDEKAKKKHSLYRSKIVIGNSVKRIKD